MKRNTVNFMLTVCLVSGLLAFSAQADLGLKQILAADGVAAVGRAVQAAVEDIYASVEDPKSIQDQIVVIINEAVATGDGETVRYALVAVMLAGGSEHLELSKTAIDNSDAFTIFPDITAVTVTTGSSLIAAMESGSTGGEVADDSGGGTKELGGGKDLGGGGEDLGGGGEDLGGGGNEMELGGGDDDNPFDDSDDAMIDDNDVVPTPK